MTAAIESHAFTTSASGLSIAVTAPAGLVAGDLVIVEVDENSGAQTWSAPDASWTLVTSLTTVAVFSHVATGSEPATWTFTRTGANAINRASALRISGANGVDTAQIIARASRGSYAFTSMTAAETNSLVIYGTISWVSQTPWTSPGGTTEFLDAAGGLVAYEILSASGATTARTFTANSAQNSSGFAIIIKSSSGGPPAAPGNIKITYQASNTFTCPTGVTSARVQCEGAGAGSGAGTALNRGGGGGGGAYAEEPTLTLVPGRTYAITVPTAPAAVTAGSFAQFVDNVTATVLVKAAGGSAGANAAGLSNGAGGAGGTTAASVGSIKTAGGAGVTGGAGGAGAAPLGGAGGTTGPGTAPGGGGGGGAALSGAGQLGSQGVVIVTFDYTYESVTSSDSVQMVVSWDRDFNETVAATDEIAKAVLKPLSDSATATDLPAKLVIKKPTDESVSTADAITRVINFLRTENLTATDFRAMLNQMAKADGVTVADAFTKLLKKTYAENMATSDAITQYLRKPMSENLTATDFAFVVLVYIRTVADTATATDVVSKVTRLSKADSAAAVDTMMKLVLKKFPNEAVSTADSAFVQVIYSRLAADSASTTDSLSKKITLGLADSISGSVSVAPTGRRIFAILSD